MYGLQVPNYGNNIQNMLVNKIPQSFRNAVTDPNAFSPPTYYQYDPYYYQPQIQLPSLPQLNRYIPGKDAFIKRL